MLKIRLRRMGKRHRPFYRVVVSDSRSVPSAPTVDEIGHYDPMTRPPRVNIDLERIEHWQERGARLTPSVAKLVKGTRTGKLERAAAKAAQPAKKAAPPKPVEVEATEAAEPEAPAAVEAAPPEAPAEELAEAKAEAAPAVEEPAAAEPEAEAKAEEPAPEPAPEAAADEAPAESAETADTAEEEA